MLTTVKALAQDATHKVAVDAEGMLSSWEQQETSSSKKKAYHMLRKGANLVKVRVATAAETDTAAVRDNLQEAPALTPNQATGNPSAPRGPAPAPAAAGVGVNKPPTGQQQPKPPASGSGASRPHHQQQQQQRPQQQPAGRWSAWTNPMVVIQAIGTAANVAHAYIARPNQAAAAQAQTQPMSSSSTTVQQQQAAADSTGNQQQQQQQQQQAGEQEQQAQGWQEEDCAAADDDANYDYAVDDYGADDCAGFQYDAGCQESGTGVSDFLFSVLGL